MTERIAKLIILILSYKTSSLFLMMMLRILAKIRLAQLQNRYSIRVITLIT